MHPKIRRKLVLTAVGWLAAAMIFFPIFWMVLTSFKTEVEAVQTPPSLFFQPTLVNYQRVLSQPAFLQFFKNTLIVSVAVTLLSLAAGSLADRSRPRFGTHLPRWRSLAWTPKRPRSSCATSWT